MASDPGTFRDHQPLAWTFHRGTARWVFTDTGGVNPPVQPGREHAGAPWTALPDGPAVRRPLSQVLADRVSCRSFRDEPVDLPRLATLLRGCYALGARLALEDLEVVERPNPSAGGLYPLELSLIVRDVDGLAPGVHHYVPGADGLELLREGPFPREWVEYLFMGQPWVAQASAVVVLSAVTGRSLVKYGDRGYRYLLLEAGHVTQTLVLLATGLGLGTVNVGGFYDDELAGLLRVDAEREVPLYATAIGVPAAEGRMARRALPGGS
ncbi:SagB-type dehydrogenase domain-containing protein [Georgenia satyanarayanai]|uniref:SagB-type dehydrogenase domain-containing protein n=1 Tax=Georgenia satyanarayanai TaxID=860221 RepID=A0A2Y9A0H8_9MICO|nr:SagB/ThcOx family dehydrogenase [Georgenia satyanarayanai]PYG02195.1 SagB-type dehydrogenase family enzyme [Georgenia satyanarayanai]SSA37028.1 SagB-type dehydrogenase domain-containing protein [Georgenia satyanarayanai]